MPSHADPGNPATDAKQETNEATDVAGRKDKGLGLADKLAPVGGPKSAEGKETDRASKNF